MLLGHFKREDDSSVSITKYSPSVVLCGVSSAFMKVYIMVVVVFICDERKANCRWNESEAFPGLLSPSGHCLS